MNSNEIKLKLRNTLRPLTANITINPNIITIIGLLTSFISAIFFAIQGIMIAGLLLLLSGFLDTLDGAVAYEKNKITKFGGFLDSISDRFADAVIIIGMIFGGFTKSPAFINSFIYIPDWFLGTTAIIFSFMVSYTRSRAESINFNNYNGESISLANVGIGERAVRMGILIFGSFLNVLNYAILILIILSLITILQRINYVKNITR